MNAIERADSSGYTVVIGLEVHAQLLTESKMFCGCAADYANEPPNTLICPICLGMPGSLPVINMRAVEFTAMTGLALNCEISELTRFDRKNYFYPDLMKNYQISQYDLPICGEGWLEVQVEGEIRRIGIRRVHLEEDTSRLAHRTEPLGRPYSLVDVNRCGTPLMEIVSEPDIKTPEEARLYLIKLRSILQYLGVSTGSMEEGSFRCDANVSIMPKGTTELGAKVEIKNMNSFRAVYRALAYEVERQAMVLGSGGRIIQETRGWDDERGVTVSQRSKEFAHDYRYFPEPDLPPLVLGREWVERIRASLPELPEARRDRLVAQLGLSLYDAEVITANRAAVEFFESALEACPNAKSVANWMINDLFGALNAAEMGIEQSKITPGVLAGLVSMIDKGTISTRIAKEVFPEMFETGKSAEQVVAERGLTQISDTGELESIVDQILASHPNVVADYIGGKKQALSFLVGGVMKLTRGKANPGIVNQLLVKKIGSRS